jgi:CelD/BcsL family acetyltransferase involved in cellulose biosynthesis
VSVAAIEGDGLTARSLREEAARAGYRLLASEPRWAPWLAIETDFDAFRRERRPRFLADLRRRRRALAREGRVELEVVCPDVGEPLAPRLDEFFRLEQSGWKALVDTAIASRPESRRFYTDVASWAARRGTLRLFFLRAGGRAIAAQLAIEEQGVLYCLKMGYDPAFARFAPGHLALHDVFAWAFARRLDRIELLGDDDAWKRRWTTTFRPRIDFRAFRPDASGVAHWAAARALAAARPALRHVYHRLCGPRTGRAVVRARGVPAQGAGSGGDDPTLAEAS